MRDYEILAEDLPEGIADLVRVIGFGATLRLIEACPGIRIRPPKEERLHAEHRLVRAVGMEAARALCRLAEGERIEVPRGKRAVLRARNRVMIRDAETMSQPQLALKYELTQRQVRTILNGFDEDVETRQAGLF